MQVSFGIDLGELPEWMATWTRRLLKNEKLESVLPELLAEIGGIVCADRSFIYWMNEKAETFELASEWCALDFEPISELIPVLAFDDMPVLRGRTLSSKAVMFSSLDEFPEEAAKERKILSDLGIESGLAVPFSRREKVAGVIAVQADRTGQGWDSGTVTLLSAIAGIISIALDQQDISLQEERFYSFFEASVDFVGFADPDSLKLLYLNPAGRELIGIGSDTPLTEISVDQFTPESLQKIKEEVIYPKVLKEGNWHGEMAIRRIDDKQEIPVMQMLVKIPFADSSSKFAIGSIIHDLRTRKAAEEKQMESERLLRNLVSAAPHALFLLIYEDSRMVVGEEGFSRLMGYTVEELRSFEHGVYEPIHPDDLPAVQAQEAALAHADDDKVASVEFRFKRKDGHWDWLEVHSKVFERDEGGRPLSEVGMAQIITGRKLAEEKLKSSEERIERAIQGTNAGFWETDFLTGKEWWSRRIFEMYGFEVAEISAEYDVFLDLIHPDDRQRVSEHLDAHLKDKEPYDIEYRSRLKSGSYHWFRGQGQADWDENGMPIRMAGSIRDIHQRKLTEQQFRRETEINRVMLHVMETFAIVLDAGGKTVRWNRAASELTGYSDQEFRETPLADLLFPVGARQRTEMLAELERIKGGARFFHSMRKIWKKGGSTRTVEYQTSGIYTEEGQLLNLILVGIDLSPHQRLQRESIRIVEQEQLRIGADLHDGLGQVLTGVGDLSRALTLRLKNAKDVAISGRIYSLVGNAISEIRRMSQGLTPLSIENRGLAGSLRILAESVEEQSKVTCTVRVDQIDEVREVEVVTQLFRIAQEAVNNAVKHSEGSLIAISLLETEQETVLTVDDDGVGIETKNESGTRGVGLTVMDYRVGLMGGTLTVGNRENGGTRVECRLRVDFDRLDKLKSGSIFLYQPKLPKIGGVE